MDDSTVKIFKKLPSKLKHAVDHEDFKGNLKITFYKNIDTP